MAKYRCRDIRAGLQFAFLSQGNQAVPDAGAT